MKYTIFGFNQAVAIHFNLSIEDLAILRFLVDFKDSGELEKKIIKGAEYVWINYDIILKEFPILAIGKRALAERIKRLCGEKCDLLESYLQKNKTGTKTFFRVKSAIYGQLIREVDSRKTEGGVVQTATGVSFKQQRGCRSNSTPGVVQTAPKDPSTIKSFLKEKKTKENTTSCISFMKSYDNGAQVKIYNTDLLAAELDKNNSYPWIENLILNNNGTNENYLKIVKWYLKSIPEKQYDMWIETYFTLTLEEIVGKLHAFLKWAYVNQEKRRNHIKKTITQTWLGRAHKTKLRSK